MSQRYHIAVLRFRHRGEFVADVDLVTDPCPEVCQEEATIRAIEKASALHCDFVSDGELLVVLDKDLVWSSRGVLGSPSSAVEVRS